MKKFIALALVTLGITLSARAQWIVYDPTLHTQSILNTAQEIGKFVEMINNHVQQIQTLTDQLNEFKHYESLFDDPKAVLLTTVQLLVNDLRKTELGETLTDLEGAMDGGEVLLYDANGLFTSIGTTFNTPNEATVTRRETHYLPVAAVQKTTDNSLFVSTDAMARQIAFKEQIAGDTNLLLPEKRTEPPMHGAERTRVSSRGSLVARDSTDHELHLATTSTVVYNTANRTG